MAPIAIGEDAELAALDKGLDAVAHAGKIGRARQRPVRNRLGERGGLGRICIERAHDVDPVERVEMIEMDHVVLHGLRRHDEIAQQPGVGRRRRADGVLYCANRGDGVDGGAHAADPLRESPGVPRVTTA